MTLLIKWRVVQREWRVAAPASHYNTRMLRLVVALCVLAVPAAAQTYEERLASEAKLLEKLLVKKCPKRKAEIESLSSKSLARRIESLQQLAPCGKASPLYHQTLASAYLDHGQFANAETSFRRALAVEVTEANQVGLLVALSRQDDLDDAQRTDVSKQLGYFRAHECDRDDLCAGLAYAAWHLGDMIVTRSAADRAIELGFPRWNAHFFGGLAYLVPPAADRAKAKRLLVEAKRRGAPADYVDSFLAKLDQ